MGRTAVAALLVPRPGAVTLHLDGQVLQLRGVYRADIPRSSLRDVVAHEGVLSFAWSLPEGGSEPGRSSETVRLDLGGDATSWATLLAKPAPTLRHKLGVRAGEGVFVVGPIPPPVEEAIEGCRSGLADASQIVAAVGTTADLGDLLPHGGQAR